MIVVDTSALARVFLREPGYESYQRSILAAQPAHIPVSCIVEFASLRRLGEPRMGWLKTFLERDDVIVVGIEPAHRELAIEAVLKFGKGSHHSAQLNFGDCLVYAVARYRDLPLLFAGDDFAHTDIVPALSPEV